MKGGIRKIGGYFEEGVKVSQTCSKWLVAQRASQTMKVYDCPPWCIDCHSLAMH